MATAKIIRTEVVETKNSIVTKKDRYLTLEEAQEIRSICTRDNKRKDGLMTPMLYIRKSMKDKYFLKFEEYPTIKEYKDTIHTLKSLDCTIYHETKEHNRRAKRQLEKGIAMDEHHQEINRKYWKDHKEAKENAEEEIHGKKDKRLEEIEETKEYLDKINKEIKKEYLDKIDKEIKEA